MSQRCHFEQCPTTFTSCSKLLLLINDWYVTWFVPKYVCYKPCILKLSVFARVLGDRKVLYVEPGWWSISYSTRNCTLLIPLGIRLLILALTFIGPFVFVCLFFFSPAYPILRVEKDPASTSTKLTIFPSKYLKNQESNGKWMWNANFNPYWQVSKNLWISTIFTDLLWKFCHNPLQISNFWIFFNRKFSIILAKSEWVDIPTPN